VNTVEEASIIRNIEQPGVQATHGCVNGPARRRIDMDSDTAMRLAAIAHIRQLLEVRDALTASDLKPGFQFEASRRSLDTYKSRDGDVRGEDCLELTGLGSGSRVELGLNSQYSIYVRNTDNYNSHGN
jgi:hypothetical protein